MRRLATGSTYAPDELHRLTGGNPFFLVEVLQNPSAAVPASARDAVLARTATLGEPARTALETASLDGFRVDPQLVGRATGVGLEVFDELVSAGLLLADETQLRFRHELARRAVASEVPPLRRLAGHQALLDALIETECDDEARLAYHAESVGDAALVTRFAPRAARRATELGAFRESAAQYERALRFPPDEPRLLAELYDGYADQLALVDSWPKAAEARERAIELWHDLGDTLREAYAHRKIASVYWRLCRGVESTTAIERALELLEPGGPDPELARTLAVHAFDVWAGDADAGRAMLRRAVEMADEVGEVTVRSDVLNNAAFGAFIDREDWVPTIRLSLQLALDAGAEAQVGRAYANAYTWFVSQYRFAEGERFWRDGIAFCDEHDITTFSTCLRGRRAVALLDLGRWDEAAAIAERVLATEASPVNLLTSQVTLGARPRPTRAARRPRGDRPRGRRGRQPARARVDRADAAGPGRDPLARRRRRRRGRRPRRDPSGPDPDGLPPGRPG